MTLNRRSSSQQLGKSLIQQEWLWIQTQRNSLNLLLVIVTTSLWRLEEISSLQAPTLLTERIKVCWLISSYTWFRKIFLLCFKIRPWTASPLSQAGLLRQARTPTHPLKLPFFILMEEVNRNSQRHKISSDSHHLSTRFNHHFNLRLHRRTHSRSKASLTAPKDALWNEYHLLNEIMVR